MLTLDTFDTQLDKNTVQKGRAYFTKKAVLYLEQSGDTLWNAEVDGSEVYSVEIQLKDRIITDAFCDCPVDSPFCKHTVAVLLAIREKLKEPKLKGKKPASKFTLESLLQKVTAEELRQFVADYAASDKVFANKIQLHFADKDERIDIGKQYTDLVKKAIRSHTSRGFVEYREAGKLAREINQLLATGHQLIARQNFRDALTVGRVVLVEMMDVIQHADDSAGHLGDTVSSALALLRQLAKTEELARPLREQLVDFLSIQLQNTIYFGYGNFGHDLLEAAFQAILLQNEPGRFLALIDQLIPLHQGPYGEYTQNHLRTTRIQFLKTIGRTDEAEALTKASLDIVEVRQAAVADAIKELDYERAKVLIRDGIQLAEQKHHPGIVRQWEEQALKLAYLEKDTPTIRQLAKAFAFDRGYGISIPFYRQWKQTFSAAEWTLEYDSLIRQITQTAEQRMRQKKASWYFETETLFFQLGPIYVEEKQWQALLDLVSQEPRLDKLEKVHEHLVSRFPSELFALYLPIVEQLGETARDRPDYRRLAQLIGLLKKDIPESIPVMNALIQQLKERNPRRPAFLEELSKLA